MSRLQAIERLQSMCETNQDLVDGSLVKVSVVTETHTQKGVGGGGGLGPFTHKIFKKAIINVKNH